MLAARINLLTESVSWLSLRVLLAAVLACALHIYRATRSDSCGCVMTFMRPSYQVMNDTAVQHPVYALYKYQEGSVRNSQPVQDLPGTPVLFLPGNGGSKRQGRSIAAEAARQAERTRAQAQLYFYVVDFRSQLSAFDATIIQQQAAYAEQCLQWMHTHLQPHLILVVGHSMGGLVARVAIAQLPSESSQQTDVQLLTVAAPTQLPPMAMLPSAARLHTHLQSKAANDLQHVAVLGGWHDWQVPSAPINRQGANTLLLRMDAIPGVGLTAEHQCTIWCNQLTQQLAYLLLHTAAAYIHNDLAQQKLQAHSASCAATWRSIQANAACLWGVPVGPRRAEALERPTGHENAPEEDAHGATFAVIGIERRRTTWSSIVPRDGVIIIVTGVQMHSDVNLTLHNGTGAYSIKPLLQPFWPASLPSQHNPAVWPSAVFQGLNYHAHVSWAGEVPMHCSAASSSMSACNESWLAIEVAAPANSGSPWPLEAPPASFAIQSTNPSAGSGHSTQAVLGLSSLLWAQQPWATHKAGTGPLDCSAEAPTLQELQLSTLLQLCYSAVPLLGLRPHVLGPLQAHKHSASVPVQDQSSAATGQLPSTTWQLLLPACCSDVFVKVQVHLSEAIYGLMYGHAHLLAAAVALSAALQALPPRLLAPRAALRGVDQPALVIAIVALSVVSLSALHPSSRLLLLLCCVGSARAMLPACNGSVMLVSQLLAPLRCYAKRQRRPASALRQGALQLVPWLPLLLLLVLTHVFAALVLASAQAFIAAVWAAASLQSAADGTNKDAQLFGENTCAAVRGAGPRFRARRTAAVNADGSPRHAPVRHKTAQHEAGSDLKQLNCQQKQCAAASVLAGLAACMAAPSFVACWHAGVLRHAWRLTDKAVALPLILGCVSACNAWPVPVTPWIARPWPIYFVLVALFAYAPMMQVT